MPAKLSNPALRQEVREAVRSATRGTTKGDIVKQFLDRGISQGSLYAWISQDMRDFAVDTVLDQRKAEQPIVPELSTMVSRGLAAPRAAGIDFQRRLMASLERADVIRAMGYGTDGKPRNIKLILEADEHERRRLQSAVFIQEKLLASAQAPMFNAFWDEVFDILRAELPEKRDQILERIQGVRLKYGSFSNG